MRLGVVTIVGLVLALAAGCTSTAPSTESPIIRSAAPASTAAEPPPTAFATHWCSALQHLANGVARMPSLLQAATEDSVVGANVDAARNLAASTKSEFTEAEAEADALPAWSAANRAVEHLRSALETTQSGVDQLLNGLELGDRQVLISSIGSANRATNELNQWSSEAERLRSAYADLSCPRLVVPSITPTVIASPSPPALTPAATTQVARVGQRLMLDDEFHTVVKVQTWKSSVFSPDRGNIYVSVLIRIEAVNEAPYNELLYKVADSEGFRYQLAFASREPSLGSGTLAPGDVVQGWIVFEVPSKSSKRLTLLFQPSILASPVSVRLY